MSSAQDRLLTKQEEFLWIVQTLILTNSVNVAAGLDQEELQKVRHNISVTGVILTAAEAIRASTRIPADMICPPPMRHMNIAISCLAT